MGYRGWLWTYGFDYSKRANDISEMFSGGIDAKNLLKQYKVDYVFIGPSERYTWKANEQFFDLNYPIVVETNTAKVYKVSDN